MPASRSRSSARRAPLQELPLDRFLLPDPNLPQRPTKRVYSPGGPITFSPTKRRILAEEGIIVSAGAISKLARIRAFPVTRNGSPTKKIDSELPASPSSASEPYPTRLTRSHAKSDASASTSPLSPIDRHVPCVDASVTQVPRELPPPVDPQSIHYPGFHVFQDAYILTGPAMGSDTGTLASPQKENVQPRRKLRKSVTAPATSEPSQERLATPDVRASSTPCTPGKLLSAERSASATPTPRRPAVVLTRDTRLTPKLRDAERLELRRRLAEEVDDIASEDEDSTLL